MRKAEFDMAVQIDAKGKPCPMPVILAKQALDRGEGDVTVLVDNHIAVENLTRLAESRGMTAVEAPAQGGFAVRITGTGGTVPAEATVVCVPCAPAGDCVFFIGKEYIGDGDRTLGGNLMKMFLYTLAQSDAPPAALLFMNGGVKLPAGEGEVIASLKELADKGCQIMVCGTCLNFYGLTEQLQVGTVSNMYDLVERMQGAGKVITV